MTLYHNLYQGISQQWCHGDSLDIDNMTTNFSLTAEGVENQHFLALGSQFPSKLDIVIPKTALWRYSGLDPKIINYTCDTEKNGTTTCIEGNPHHIDNMTINFSLTDGGVENHHFLALGVKVHYKFDIVIPKTPLYEGMVVWILK